MNDKGVFTVTCTNNGKKSYWIYPKLQRKTSFRNFLKYL
jgi:hypothetical protein